MRHLLFLLCALHVKVHIAIITNKQYTHTIWATYSSTRISLNSNHSSHGQPCCLCVLRERLRRLILGALKCICGTHANDLCDYAARWCGLSGLFTSGYSHSARPCKFRAPLQIATRNSLCRGARRKKHTPQLRTHSRGRNAFVCLVTRALHCSELVF